MRGGAGAVDIVLLAWAVAACGQPTSPDDGSPGAMGAEDTTSEASAGPDASDSDAPPVPDVPDEPGEPPVPDVPDEPGEPPDPDVPPSGRVLMYVAFNDTWWAEYKVTYEGLRAAGYEVEVRSSTDDALAMSYGGPVDATPGGFPGVAPMPYDELRALFEASFGVAWDPAWNQPTTIPLDGRIQDANMEDYVALVFPGGSGAQLSRYDGTYEDLLGPAEAPDHVSPASDMASAAAAINDLVVAALVQGSPVLAVCHAGPTPGFARVPNTQGLGPDGLGLSLLNGRSATGYPLANEIDGVPGDVAEQYAALGIQFLPEAVVVVDGPSADLDGDGQLDGAGLVVTSRSWYPEEVVQGVSALLELLDP